MESIVQSSTGRSRAVLVAKEVIDRVVRTGSVHVHSIDERACLYGVIATPIAVVALAVRAVISPFVCILKCNPCHTTWLTASCEKLAVHACDVADDKHIVDASQDSEVRREILAYAAEQISADVGRNTQYSETSYAIADAVSFVYNTHFQRDNLKSVTPIDIVRAYVTGKLKG